MKKHYIAIACSIGLLFPSPLYGFGIRNLINQIKSSCITLVASCFSFLPKFRNYHPKSDRQDADIIIPTASTTKGGNNITSQQDTIPLQQDIIPSKNIEMLINKCVFQHVSYTRNNIIKTMVAASHVDEFLNHHDNQIIDYASLTDQHAKEGAFNQLANNLISTYCNHIVVPEQNTSDEEAAASAHITRLYEEDFTQHTELPEHIILTQHNEEVYKDLLKLKLDKRAAMVITNRIDNKNRRKKQKKQTTAILKHLQSNDSKISTLIHQNNELVRYIKLLVCQTNSPEIGNNLKKRKPIGLAHESIHHINSPKERHTPGHRRSRLHRYGTHKAIIESNSKKKAHA